MKLAFFIFAALLVASGKHVRRSGNDLQSATLSSRSQALANAATARFKELDTDHDGALQPAELQTAVTSLNMGGWITDHNAARALKAARRLSDRDELSMSKARQLAIGYGSHDSAGTLDRALAGKGGSNNPAPTPAPVPPPTDCPPFQHKQSGQCKCENVRHDWGTLPPSWKVVYLRAIKKAFETDTLYKFAHVHKEQEEFAHGSNVFLPWHRRFLLAFEEALRSLHDDFKCVSIPYWDWAQSKVEGTGMGDMFVETGGWGRMASDAPFQGGEGLAFHYIDYSQMHDGESPLNRGPENNNAYQRHGNQVDLAFLTDFDDYEKMRAELEGYHGTAHCTVGADMCSMWSPKDPIFYSHHALIDKIWLRWQQCHDKLECGPDTFTEANEPNGYQWIKWNFNGYNGQSPDVKDEFLGAVETEMDANEADFLHTFEHQGSAVFHQVMNCDSGLPFYPGGPYSGECGFDVDNRPFNWTARSVREAFRTQHLDDTGEWGYGADEFMDVFSSYCQGDGGSMPENFKGKINRLNNHFRAIHNATMSSELQAEGLAKSELYTLHMASPLLACSRDLGGPDHLAGVVRCACGTKNGKDIAPSTKKQRALFPCNRDPTPLCKKTVKELKSMCHEKAKPQTCDAKKLKRPPRFVFGFEPKKSVKPPKRAICRARCWDKFAGKNQRQLTRCYSDCPGTRPRPVARRPTIAICKTKCWKKFASKGSKALLPCYRKCVKKPFIKPVQPPMTGNTNRCFKNKKGKTMLSKGFPRGDWKPTNKADCKKPFIKPIKPLKPVEARITGNTKRCFSKGDDVKYSYGAPPAGYKYNGPACRPGYKKKKYGF